MKTKKTKILAQIIILLIVISIILIPVGLFLWNFVLKGIVVWVMNSVLFRNVITIYLIVFILFIILLISFCLLINLIKRLKQGPGKFTSGGYMKKTITDIINRILNEDEFSILDAYELKHDFAQKIRSVDVFEDPELKSELMQHIRVIASALNKPVVVTEELIRYNGFNLEQKQVILSLLKGVD